MVSVAPREMVQDTEDAVAKAFYLECQSRDVFVQHILYNAADFGLLARLLPDTLLFDPGLQLIFVLGRYNKNQESAPGDLTPVLARKKAMGLMPDWGSVPLVGAKPIAFARRTGEAGGLSRSARPVETGTEYKCRTNVQF